MSGNAVLISILVVRASGTARYQKCRSVSKLIRLSMERPSKRSAIASSARA